MVYYVVSDESLTHDVLINVLCEVNSRNSQDVTSGTHYITVDKLPQHNWNAEDEYYVQVMERKHDDDQYEYLVMTLVEMRQVLKMQADANSDTATTSKQSAAE